MKKLAVLAILSVFLLGGAAAQETGSEYQYDIQNKYFQPAQTIQSLDSSGEVAGAVTFEPTSALDDSIFLWDENNLKWSAQHRTVGTPTDISVSEKGAVLSFDTGDRGMIPFSGDPVPDEPVIFADVNGQALEVEQGDNIIFSITESPSVDAAGLNLYDSEIVFNEGNQTYAGGASITYDTANDVAPQEIAYSNGKLFLTAQKAGQQESQLRVYTVEGYDSITESRVVNFTELATDLETNNNGEAAVLFNDGEIKTFNNKGKEQRSISFAASGNADDIGFNNKHILVYGSSIMYAVNPDTATVNELFDIDRSLKPVNAGDWLVADGNTMTYTPDSNVFREVGSFGAGGLQELADFIFKDVAGFSNQNAQYAAAFTIILISTGSLAFVAGGTGALFGGALGITISSATGLLPVEIIFIMMALAAVALYSRVTGGGGGDNAASGGAV